MCDASALREIFAEHSPAAVLHLAAESHVDRSIDGPGEFIHTNVVGTFTLLQESAALLAVASAPTRASFRFVHVSTDEVFGSLGPTGSSPRARPTARTRRTRRARRRADHLARAWFTPTGCRSITTNCSNNYGPYQFPEKLIPLVIQHAPQGKPLPVYGDGENVRDWLFVEDHARALLARARAAARRRDVQHRRRQGTRNNRRRARRSARWSTSCPLPSADRERAHHVRHRPAGTRSAIRHRRQQSSASSAGGRASLRQPDCERPCLVSGEPGWCERVQSGAIAANDSASERVVTRKGIILAGGAGTRLHP